MGNYKSKNSEKKININHKKKEVINEIIIELKVSAE